MDQSQLHFVKEHSVPSKQHASLAVRKQVPTRPPASERLEAFPHSKDCRVSEGELVFKNLCFASLLSWKSIG